MIKTSILLIIIFLGFLIVALPDSDVRLFSISKAHGPSLQDAVGLVLILFPYAVLVWKAWKRKSLLEKYHSARLFKTGLFLSGLGTGLLIASVANDYDYWWVYGIAMLVIVQIVLFYVLLR